MFIKGFDKDLKCRGFQFEVGKEYKTGKEKLELCTDSVFHFCDSIQKVHSFYDVQESRFCEVEALGEIVKDEQKCGTNHIKIVREITGDELNTLIGKINGNTGIFNTSYYNAGNRNAGNRNTGNYNSGNYNAGDYNTGSYNSSYYNTGNRNTGSYNSSDYNTGNYNSGHCNSGNYNSGNFNSCDFSSGIFCNKDPEVLIFNQPSGMTMREFRDSQYISALFSETIELTYLEDGKLLKRDYKEACKLWWSKLTKKNKKIIQSLPNFDKEVFFDITGIEVKE
jgi:hypothetical protein